MVSLMFPPRWVQTQRARSFQSSVQFFSVKSHMDSNTPADKRQNEPYNNRACLELLQHVWQQCSRWEGNLCNWQHHCCYGNNKFEILRTCRHCSQMQMSLSSSSLAKIINARRTLYVKGCKVCLLSDCALQILILSHNNGDMTHTLQLAMIRHTLHLCGESGQLGLGFQTTVGICTCHPICLVFISKIRASPL